MFTQPLKSRNEVAKNWVRVRTCAKPKGMIGWLLRATCATVILGAVGYLIVSVPVGRKTLFEHGLAIYRTEPAQELAEDVEEAASAAVERVKVSLEKTAERSSSP